MKKRKGAPNMLKEELDRAEEEARKANARLAEVRRKSFNLEMMLCAVRYARKGENLEYNIAVLKYYLFEVNLFTPAEFASHDRPGMPLVTPAYLLELEKDEHDRIAQRLMKEIESDGRVDDPDAALERTKEHNKKGHQKINEAEIRKLEKDIRRHKIKNAQEKLTTILSDNSVYPSTRQCKIVEFLKLMEHDGILYEELKINKSLLFEIGYKGI